MEKMEFAYWEENALDVWKEIMKKELAQSKRFEIQLWNDENELTDLLLQHGNFQEENWEGGVIVEGDVTEDFIEFLFSFEAEEKEGEMRITPFYDIVLDAFESEDYGRELKRL